MEKRGKKTRDTLRSAALETVSSFLQAIVMVIEFAVPVEENKWEEMAFAGTKGFFELETCCRSMTSNKFGFRRSEHMKSIVQCEVENGEQYK